MAQRQEDRQRPPGYEPASARSRANTWPLPPEADGFDEDGPPVHEDLQQDPAIWDHHHQRAFSQQAAGNGMMMSASPLMLGGCKTEPGLRASPTSGADSICGGAASSMLVCKSEPVEPGAEECALLMNCKSEPGLSMAVDDVKLAAGGQQLQQPGLSDSSSVMPKPKNSNRRNAWGPHSYADLITQAILSSPEKRLTLAQVYDWMVTNIPWFKDKGDSTSSAGWKNSIRHNLSLHSRFVKVQNEGTGKSSWWMINPDAAKSGKCTRRRATIDSSKFEKKRGRSKKKADPMRNGLSEHTGGSPATGNGIQELDGRFPESPLHPAHPAFLGPAAEFRRAGGPGVPPGWPFRRLESYPQERHHEPMEVTNGMAPPFRSLGYQLYSGQPNGFPSNGHHPPSLMLPSTLSDAGERVFNGYQAVSPAASVSSISPSQSSAVDPGSGHYPPPGSEPLYSAAAAAVSSSGYAPSPSSSSFTPSPSNLFTSASPVSSVGGSFPVSSFCTSGSLQPLAQLPGFCGDPASFAAMRAAAAAAANTAGCITVPARDEPETPSQLMSNLMGALQPNNMPVDLDLETFQGGLDCDVDNIIKQELSMDGSLDFSFNQAAAAQAAAAAAQHHMAGVEARHTLTNVYINTSTVNVNVNPRHWQHVNPSLVD